jgi:hypothetical protein
MTEAEYYTFSKHHLAPPSGFELPARRPIRVRSLQVSWTCPILTIRQERPRPLRTMVAHLQSTTASVHSLVFIDLQLASLARQSREESDDPMYELVNDWPGP